MPPMKIQPIDIPVDSQKLKDAVVRNDAAKPVLKLRSPCSTTTEDDCGELELIFGEKGSLPDPGPEPDPVDETTKPAVVVTASPSWQLPAIKPKSIEKGTKVVTGLASLLGQGGSR
ncbi:hypothetical protein K1719_000892 [Acacia pycnantha]|nr:hypothetical protein K1719_000892 [Acacia pycnantha]